MIPDDVFRRLLRKKAPRRKSAAIRDHKICNLEGVRAGDTLLVGVWRGSLNDGWPAKPRDSDRLYHVVRLHQDSETKELTDLDIEELRWRNPRTLTDDDMPSYCIDGESVTTFNLSKSPDNKGACRFREHPGIERKDSFLTCILNPHHADLRSMLWNSECPVGCINGWLKDKFILKQAMGLEGLPNVHNFRPLCPVCMGSDIVARQIKMRAKMDRSREPDPDPEGRYWAWFRSTIMHRRWILGYDSEDCCNCFLCLMPMSFYPTPMNHGEANRFYYALREFDATAAMQDRPASTTAVDALPRRNYFETASEEDKCTVCQGDFERDTRVIELPCTHIICEDVCIEWLKHSDSCPVCRRKVVIDTSAVTTCPEREASNGTTSEAGYGASANDNVDQIWDDPGPTDPVIAQPTVTEVIHSNITVLNDPAATVEGHATVRVFTGPVDVDSLPHLPGYDGIDWDDDAMYEWPPESADWTELERAGWRDQQKALQRPMIDEM